jgi:hypothetical protein
MNMSSPTSMNFGINVWGALCAAARKKMSVDPVNWDCLVIHKLAGVHGGYAKPSMESLRPAQDRIAKELMMRCGILKRDETGTIKIAG